MAAVDLYPGSASSSLAADSPGRIAFAITPDNSNDLAFVTRGIYVGATGDIAVVMQDGSAVTFKNVAASVILPIRVSRVMSTGTTPSMFLIGLA